MIAFGQNVPEHPDIPKRSRWRNKRSRRQYVVIASSESHVLYADTIDARGRTLSAVKWLAGFKRL